LAGEYFNVLFNEAVQCQTTRDTRDMGDSRGAEKSSDVKMKNKK
jgi:hypothetical protein